MQRLKIGSAWGVGCATETCSLEDDTVVTCSYRSWTWGQGCHGLPLFLLRGFAWLCEVSDLLFRDITPEDYEILLRLDDTVSRPSEETG